MYLVELALRMNPVPVSVQRKEQADAEALYQQVRQALEQGQPRLLELTCEKVEGKKVTLLISEVLAVQLYEKTAATGGSKGQDSPLNPDPATAELILDQVSYRWPGGQLALAGCNLTIPGTGPVDAGGQQREWQEHAVPVDCRIAAAAGRPDHTAASRCPCFSES